MDEQLSRSEKLAIRGVMQDTFFASGAFASRDKLGRRTAGELWPKLAEAIMDAETFDGAEETLQRIIAEIIVEMKKNGTEDAEFRQRLLEIVFENARETYCEMRGIPCEVRELRPDIDEEELEEDEKGAEVIHVDFGRRSPM